MDVVLVSRDSLMDLAGEPWATVVASDKGTLVSGIAHHNSIYVQQDHPKWTPPVDKFDKPLPVLPLNHAWLREVDGRAFLYIQNW